MRLKLVYRFILVFLLFSHQTVFSQNIDIKLLRYINSSEDLRSDKVFQFISDSNAWIIAGTPVAMGTVGIIKRNESLTRNAIVVSAATVLNMGVTVALKYSANRSRPFVTYPDIRKKSGAASPSFPSGHTSGAFATATIISIEYPRWYVIVPAYTWASLVGFSRMDLGVHYPSDVLAGAAIGTGCAWLTSVVNKKLQLKHRNQKPVSAF
jgi:membrane-associated phospholipid phosphatase